jgi:hypothetical protein
MPFAGEAGFSNWIQKLSKRHIHAYGGRESRPGGRGDRRGRRVLAAAGALAVGAQVAAPVTEGAGDTEQRIRRTVPGLPQCGSALTKHRSRHTRGPAYPDIDIVVSQTDGALMRRTDTGEGPARPADARLQSGEAVATRDVFVYRV